MKILKLYLIIYVSLLISINAQETDQTIKDEDYEKLSVFTEVLNYIKTNYVKNIDNTTLIYGAIKGMMSTLDPYSNFMQPDVFKELQVETTGQFGGVGIEVSFKDDKLTVISPIEGTPADKAGILPGDEIVKIDNRSTKDISVFTAMNLMRGAKGTFIIITIMRKGFKQPKDFTIARDIIKIDSVDSKLLSDNIGYIRIKSFQNKTSLDIKRHYDDLDKQNKLHGLILDLRNNPGGVLEESIQTADLFLDQGKIVIFEGRIKDQKKIEEAKKENTFRFLPMVVLINEGSASASEIVAGALKDNNRAIILGTKSFGKGYIQTVIELSDGSGLKLTVANYYTPNGNTIHNIGIHPHITVVQNTKEKKDLFLNKALYCITHWKSEEISKFLK